MQYRSDIDGLRAVAVLPVILFHAGLAGLEGGYLGVDVFFVISGYLISKILLDDIHNGRFSLLGFYERRARRLLPALFVVLFASFVLALAWAPPALFRDFTQSLAAISVFSSNILFWWEVGYFDHTAELKPLLHTWSLAVEEQYYLVFPVLLAGLWPLGRRRLLIVFSLVFLFSLIAADWASRVMPHAAFFLAPFRIWELLAGTLVALWLHGRARRSNNLGAACGLLAILGAMASFDTATRTPSLWTLIPVLGTCAIILWSGPSTWVGRGLGARPFVALGLISYSAYLWHQPVFAFTRIRSLYEPSPELMLGLTGITFCLAWGTWVYVEKPFRYRVHSTQAQRPFASRRSWLVVSYVGLAMVFCTGLWGHLSNGRAHLWSAAMSSEKRVLFETIRRAQEDHVTNSAAPIDHSACVFSDLMLTDAFLERAKRCRSMHGPGILVLGDSHGIDIFQMAALSSGPQMPFVTGLVQGGCRPHDPQTKCAYDALLHLIKKEADLWSTIIFNQAGFYLLTNEAGKKITRQTFSVPLSQALPRLTPDNTRIDQVATYLDQLNARIPVIWLGPRLEPHVPVELIRRQGCEAPIRLRPGQVEIFATLDLAAQHAATARQVSYVSLQDQLDLRLPDDLRDCDTIFWVDGDHFSAAGEARFAPRLKIWTPSPDTTLRRDADAPRHPGRRL